MSDWVLKDRDRYFRAWTGIGPAQTTDINEAHRFASKHEALAHPASRFALTLFEPEELPPKEQEGDQ